MTTLKRRAKKAVRPIWGKSVEPETVTDRGTNEKAEVKKTVIVDRDTDDNLGEEDFKWDWAKAIYTFLEES